MPFLWRNAPFRQPPRHFQAALVAVAARSPPPPSDNPTIKDHVFDVSPKPEWICYPNKWSFEVRPGGQVNMLVAYDVKLNAVDRKTGQTRQMKKGQTMTLSDPSAQYRLVQETPRPWWAWMAEWLPGP